ncbi:SCO family protein [Planctobacterium marinum]|uniref:SCO family protein n=1 Tax=Planctobacterium marinum TaxID=1631968 RepID=UPI001E4C1A12|nr:SCO family protein [Planctobacterium marinum]MCC2606458.1 SCO family protein [Planctobacterium marinum]
MKQPVFLGSIAVIALVAGVWLALNIAPPSVSEPAYAQMYPAPRMLNDGELNGHDGSTITPDWFKDQWTLVFVGYTWCPDICPTTLAELKRIYPQLTKLSEHPPVKVLFISVDPGRDDTARLKQYIEFFNPDFYAATAEHKQLFPFIRSMGMAYAIAESTDKPDYLVDHSASMVIVNPDGHVIGRFKPDHKPGQLAISDAQQILADMPLIMARYQARD